MNRPLESTQSGTAPRTPVLWLTLGGLCGVSLILGLASFLNKNGQRPPLTAPRSLEPRPQEVSTRIYRIPPLLLAPDPGSGAGLDPRPWLQKQGITFPPGSSASFIPATSQLIVRNTHANLALVDAAIDAATAQPQQEQGQDLHQISLTTRMLRLPVNWPAISQGGETAQPESLLGDLSQPISAILTEPQLQAVLRHLDQTSGTEQVQLPSVMPRNGQRTLLTVADKTILNVIPTLGRDGYTIELEIHLESENREPTATKTIWDGQTLVLPSPPEEDRRTLYFVTARIIAPNEESLNPLEGAPPSHRE